MTKKVERPRRPWWRWLLLVVGPVVLVALFSMIGFEAVGAVLKGADRVAVGLALAMAVPALLLRSWRWKLLLGPDGDGMNYREVTAVFAHAVFVGTATPGRIGEFLKILHLRERGIPTGRALASVLLDRLLDVGLLLVMATAGLALLVGGSDVVVGVAAVGLFVVAIWLAKILVCGAPADQMGRFLAPVAPQKLAEPVARLRCGLCEALDALPRRALAGGVLLTLVAWGINYFANYQLALAIGLPLSYFEVAGISAVASLVVLLPISVAGAGTRDVAMVALLAAYGIGEAQAVALSSMFLVFIVWNALMCGTSSFTRYVRSAR